MDKEEFNEREMEKDFVTNLVDLKAQAILFNLQEKQLSIEGKEDQ